MNHRVKRIKSLVSLVRESSFGGLMSEKRGADTAPRITPDTPDTPNTVLDEEQ